MADAVRRLTAETNRKKTPGLQQSPEAQGVSYPNAKDLIRMSLGRRRAHPAAGFRFARRATMRSAREAKPQTRMPESRRNRWLKFTRLMLTARASADHPIYSSRARSRKVAEPKPLPPRTPRHSERIQQRIWPQGERAHLGGWRAAIIASRSQRWPPPTGRVVRKRCVSLCACTTRVSGRDGWRRRNATCQRTSQVSANRNGGDRPACPKHARTRSPTKVWTVERHGVPLSSACFISTYDCS